ncbi:MAG: protoglobin domain-containing protein [Planctomycetota bacterium]
MSRSILAGAVAAPILLSLSAGCATVSTAQPSLRPDGSIIGAPRSNRGFEAISESELALLKKSVLFTEEDARYLRMSKAVLSPHLDELLGVWYGFVGANEHLLYYFSSPSTGDPQPEYLARVRERFGRWVLETADADFDQAWLNRQLEIGLRHHRIAKNTTDDADAAAHIPLRYMIALYYPVTATMEPFLARGGHSEEDVRKMHAAWEKAVLMSAILWVQPYTPPRDF